MSVSKNLQTRADYVTALHQEIEREIRGERELRSIYFGGGTPTELSPDQLSGLLGAILARAPLALQAEITIEANPENLNFDILCQLRAAGFNRISLGVQSLDDVTLAHFGRAHRVQNVQNANRAARAAGFENISIDLIYGAPFTPPDLWRQTLEMALELEPQHISAYSLTVESGTHFGFLQKRGQLQFADDDSQAVLMEIAAQVLKSAGFHRYEVSNWALAGFQSAHNTNYWRGGDYFGLGNGAHGHFGGHRFWNVRSVAQFAARLKAGKSPREGEEFLSPIQRLEERLVLGLRTVEGVDLEGARFTLGLDGAKLWAKGLRLFEKEGLLRCQGDFVRPTPRGLPLADGMAFKILRMSADNSV